MESLIKSKIRDLVPYPADEMKSRAKLDANENPYNLFERFRGEFLHRAASVELNRYPDSNCGELSRAIAKANGAEKENVICGNGSDEIMQIIINTFVERGDKVIVAPPTFSMYGFFTSIAGGEVVQVPLLENFALNTPEIIRQAREQQAKVIFLCSPNNPTGTLAPRAEIVKIIGETTGLVVLDEAYAEFSAETNLDLALVNPRVVLLRTLSKAFALAGARVGYGIGCSTTVQALKRVKAPYNLNSFSQLAGKIVLDNIDLVKLTVAKIIRERERLLNALKEIQGITVFPSQANFVLIRADDFSIALQDFRAKGIKVRTFSGQRQLENCMRVTVGSRAENQEIINILKRRYAR